MERHATVIGASIAGLVAARVLSGHFEQHRDLAPFRAAPGGGWRNVTAWRAVAGHGRSSLNCLFGCAPSTFRAFSFLVR